MTHTELRLLLGGAACFLAIAYMAGAGDVYGDAAVFCAVGVMLRWKRDVLISALAAFFLTVAAYPPFRYWTFMISLASVFASWRSAGRQAVVVAEGFAFGLALAWWSLPHVGLAFIDNQAFARLPASGFIALHFMCLASLSCLTAPLPRPIAAVIVAVAGAALEAGRMYMLDFPLLLLAQPAAGTPLAQWARIFGIWGVSAILYFVNCLAWPVWPGQLQSPLQRLYRACSGSLGAAGVLSIAWIGGIGLSRGVADDSLPIDLILVQPRVRDGRAIAEVNGQHFTLLQHWTNQAVEKRSHSGQSKPELIIWPEFATSLAPDKLAEGTNNPAHWLIEREWADAILFGAVVIDPENRTTNSAVLVERDGNVQRYDKMKMIPFAETMPHWLKGNGWGRAIARFFGVNAPFEPGTDYHLLTLTRPGRDLARTGISLCCEAHFPQLPQYRNTSDCGMIIHLSNEDWFTDVFPEMAWFTTWNIQYRAIETRSWQVICSTSANSAIVDRRGAIRLILGPEPGALDSEPCSRKRVSK